MYRKLAYLVAFVLLLSLSARTDGAAEVAHWRLDNDLTDSVGGIEGTLMNGAGFILSISLAHTLWMVIQLCAMCVCEKRPVISIGFVVSRRCFKRSLRKFFPWMV